MDNRRNPTTSANDVGATITRVMLRDIIRERIVERILDNTYPPGTHLVESTIAKEFGTSQGPIREALRDLEGMRLIESEPHRGARVRRISIAELSQVYSVRAALEEVAGREAAPKMTPALLQQLEGELDQMRDAASSGDAHAQLLHDVRFHQLIFEATENQVLLEIWRSLQVEGRTLVSSIMSGSNLHMVAEMHAPILEALKLHDPHLAGQEMRGHIEYFGSHLTEASDPRFKELNEGLS